MYAVKSLRAESSWGEKLDAEGRFGCEAFAPRLVLILLLFFSVYQVPLMLPELTNLRILLLALEQMVVLWRWLGYPINQLQM
jgi:hypothetical protein